ncbi:hypothetical protein O6P43_006246 [Quillaja saponaria]|uniref:Uncharacterized protein n=1 Tax=Quillaja saponaria TaxID=32244 RepID=A0AAD7Q7T8_QUISA|nr:hypothetical protein O6P43_006246 [Quillaja saponaria]
MRELWMLYQIFSSSVQETKGKSSYMGRHCIESLKMLFQFSIWCGRWNHYGSTRRVSKCTCGGQVSPETAEALLSLQNWLQCTIKLVDMEESTGELGKIESVFHWNTDGDADFLA